MEKWILFVLACTATLSNAFVGKSMTTGRQQTNNSSPKFILSSKTPDVEDVAEIVAETNANGSKGRYDDLISSLGLDDKLKHAKTLPKDRVISSYDVFCNRELTNSKIKAIGFDMDYT